MNKLPQLNATAKGTLIYIAAIATVIGVHSIALNLDRAAEDEPRTQAPNQRQV